MRKLQVLKRFGEVYNESSGPGSLTIFCPSCPQPGINLPPEWIHYPNWVTRRTITVDGNFHADRIKTRRPDQDINLSNGQGFMAEDVRYREYLSVAKEPRVVGWLWCFVFVSILTSSSRGHLVGITELSTTPTPTIGIT